MTKLLYTLLLATIFSQAPAQAFEGVLQIDYRTETGSKNAVDVYVKGDHFFIKKVYGGCDRYDAYVYDTKNHTLVCMSPQSPRTALHMDIEKVLDIYETKQLKPGYKIHMSQPYAATSQTKKISDNKVIQKKAAGDNDNYEIWTSELNINYKALLPLLRVIGYWGETEDGNNVILESKATNKKTSKTSTVTVVVLKNKVDDNLFKVSADYQQVDLDKFLINEYKSPRFGDLVKAFTAF